MSLRGILQSVVIPPSVDDEERLGWIVVKSTSPSFEHFTYRIIFYIVKSTLLLLLLLQMESSLLLSISLAVW